MIADYCEETEKQWEAQLEPLTKTKKIQAKFKPAEAPRKLIEEFKDKLETTSTKEKKGALSTLTNAFGADTSTKKPLSAHERSELARKKFIEKSKRA